MFSKLIEAARQLLALIEANYTYEIINVKRWIENADACELCQDNADRGWIEDDDVFEGVFGPVDGPPGHPHCFSEGTIIATVGPIAAHTGRGFRGEVIVLCVPGAEDITVTPNHPILTRQGWRAAGALEVDDELLQCIAPNKAFSLINPQDNYIESRIEQIPCASLMSRSMTTSRVPSSPEDFHGDGQINGEVNIVRPAGFLNRDVISELAADSERFHFPEHVSFAIGKWQRMPFSLDGPFAEIFNAASHPSDRIMSRSDLSRLLGRGHLGGSNLLCGAAGSLLEPRAIPMCSDGSPGYSEPVRDRQEALSRLVRFVKPIKIQRRQFDGHVYNLQTRYGCYFAGTILAHNCDCDLEYGEKRKRVYD